jgi:hypothetical protein
MKPAGHIDEQGPILQKGDANSKKYWGTLEP